jgi:rod shape-determining protein MreC
VVQLITDAQSEIGAMLKESRIQGVFKGNGGRDLELDYIDNDSDIVEGNELISSGLDRIHPKGLPIARVVSVKPGPGLFKIVLARPVADMRRLEEVLIITEPPALAPEQPSDTSSTPPTSN